MKTSSIGGLMTRQRRANTRETKLIGLGGSAFSCICVMQTGIGVGLSAKIKEREYHTHHHFKISELLEPGDCGNTAILETVDNVCFTVTRHSDMLDFRVHDNKHLSIASVCVPTWALTSASPAGYGLGDTPCHE